MADDLLAAVAGWLADQLHNQHQLGDIVRALAKTTPERQAPVAAVQAAVELLDVAGLCTVHHGSMSSVFARQRDALRRVADGEPLAAVAADVEPDRPVTIVRVQSGEYAAWYLTPMRLPACATTLGLGGALGPTPTEAYAALRARVTSELDVPPDQTTTGQ